MPELRVEAHEVEHVKGLAVIAFGPGAEPGEGRRLSLRRQRHLVNGRQVAVDFLAGEPPPGWGMPEPEGKKEAQANRTNTEHDHPEVP